MTEPHGPFAEVMTAAGLTATLSYIVGGQLPNLHSYTYTSPMGTVQVVDEGDYVAISFQPGMDLQHDLGQEGYQLALVRPVRGTPLILEPFQEGNTALIPHEGGLDVHVPYRIMVIAPDQERPVTVIY